jgi:hypothetical protein
MFIATPYKNKGLSEVRQELFHVDQYSMLPYNVHGVRKSDSLRSLAGYWRDLPLPGGSGSTSRHSAFQADCRG